MKKEVWQITALFIIELMLLLPISFALNIYNTQATDITSSSAKVNWQTDEYATGIVYYGRTEELGYKQRHTNYLFEHSLYLYGLEDETTYYFAVESTDINGTTKVDNNSDNFYTFTTSDITPPEQVNGLTAESIGINYVYVKWNSVNAPDLSYYNIYRDRIKIANTTLTSFNDTGLISDRAYSYKVSAVDTSDNEGSLSDTIIATTLETDVTVPVITDVEVDEITDTTATISWITDENATSVVYYGINQSLDNIKEDNNLVLNHTLVVTGLLKGYKYSYKVSSCDRDNNCVDATVGEFEAGADLTPPIINATIPEFYNEKRIDIIGSVEPYSKVRLYVNDMLSAKRALDSDETSDGKFEFYNVVLSQDNVIKIWAQDKAGNVNQKSYNLVLDTEDPVVNLEDIPSVITEKNITIKGNVNEFVTINVYLISGGEAEPEKITGLEAEASNNSVELSWDKSTEEDFSHYVIYRGDVGAIAITEPASYNSYRDVLVNNGESYTYQVSAVNEFGKESLKSEPVTVLISGGETGLPKPNEITDVIRGVKKPTLSLNVSGSFSKSITLKEDGVYSLEIEFIDKALNIVLIEKEITLDTKPPEIEITRPSKGAFIYENYANEVDIEGTTEPFAEVHLYVERTPLGFLNKSFDVSGLPNEIQDLPESELRADCRLVVGGTSFCSTGADFSTYADGDGYFKFENVDLTSWFGIGASVTEIPATEFTRERELKEATETRLVFIATDNAGMRNSLGIKYNIGTCWSGNFSWELTPLLAYQSPSVLSMERLRENTEQIFFYFNYTYVGRGRDGRITQEQSGVTVSKACSDLDILRDARFNISCQILPAAGQTIANPEGGISYTTVKLNRLENMDRWLEDDWRGFFDAVGNELTFPFKVRITYKHEVNGETIIETQTTCQEVTYVLDNSLVDPREVLPDWVLYDMVDFLNESIATINDVQEELRKVIDYVAVGCVSSFLLRLVWQVYRRLVSFFDEKTFMIKESLGIGSLEFETEKEEDKDYCKDVAKAIASKEGYNLGDEFRNVKLKYFSDKDLEKCFPATAAAWETEAKLYNLYRLSCDRLFGHKTPSKWTEQATNDKLYTTLKKGTGCAVDQGVMGQPLLANKCRDVAKHYHLDPDNYGMDDKCLVVKKEGKEALYTMESYPENREYNIYKIKHREAGFELSSNYAIKQTENSYLTAQDEYCAQACDITKEKEAAAEFGVKRRWNEGNPREEIKKEESKGYWECMPAHECTTLEDKPDVEIHIDNVYLRGYTKDCFYKAGESVSLSQELKDRLGQAESVSDEPERRYECCCINAVKAPPSKYYQYDDKVRYTVVDSNGQLYPEHGEQPAYAFESKKEEGEEPQGGTKGEQWADMKWSYRYWKEKYETVSNEFYGENKRRSHYEYNPNRYTTGRDFPACFGLNSWQYDLGAKPGDGKLLIIDPAKQHISAFQCLHVTGIYNRLLLLKNMMSALSSCLITVRVSGRADTGVCKELFSQYICSTIWYVIQHFKSGCLPFGTGLDLTESENKLVEYVSAGLKSVWGSVADSRSELMEEYGNAKLNNLLGTGEEAIARKVCLAAFGYDWELGLEDVIDAAYASPYATLVQKMTSTREFLTVDPDTTKAKYEYRASWLINPGCDMRNYKVELSCVSRNDMYEYEGINCEKVEDPAGHNCDCLGLPEEKKEPFYSHTTKLAQGTLEDRDWNEIITSDYRFDHLKFTVYPDTTISSELADSCFPEGYYYGGEGVFYFPIRDKTIVDVAACYLDWSQGLFICKPPVDFWTEQGRAYFDGVMINGEETEEKEEIVMFRGDDLKVEPTIRKLAGNPVCLVIELEKPSMKTEKWGKLIEADGTYDYPYTIEEKVQPVRTGQIQAELYDCELTEEEKKKEENRNKRCENVIGTKRLWYSILSFSTAQTQTLKVTFVDEWDESSGRKGFDGKITISDKSEDRIIFGADRTIEDWWKEDGLVLEGQGVKIKIRSVEFDTKIVSAKYKIEITPAEEAEEQKWTLRLSLRHTKPNSTDCSTYGDVIEYQGRTQKEGPYKIKIGEKASSFKPKVSLGDIDTSGLQREDGSAKIIAYIEYYARIDGKVNEIKKVKYEIETSGGGKIDGDINLSKCSTSPTTGDLEKMECDITVKKDKFKFAGDHYVTVEAEDVHGNEDDSTKHFNVECYNDKEWGECQEGGCDDEIEPPLSSLNCVGGYKCCKLGVN